MTYREQFIIFREARGLSRERLAAIAKCHRNTVINLESGRPVRFQTIANLMAKMDYPPDSSETKLLAVLWLESVTGIHVSLADAKRVVVNNQGGRIVQAMDALKREMLRAKLAAEDIELLALAVRHREILNVLKAIRNLLPKPSA